MPSKQNNGSNSAKNFVEENSKKSGIASAVIGWVKSWGGTEISNNTIANLPPAQNTENVDWISGGDAVSTGLLSGGSGTEGRDRQTIYSRWAEMAADGIGHQAVKIKVTAALGGHETEGRLVNIETAAGFEKDASAKKACEELQAELGGMLDGALPTVCTHAASFGDGFARPYLKDGVGIVDLVVGDLVYPPLVLPYERGSKTVGYLVATGMKGQERLTINQLLRMKMPRRMHTPQPRAAEKNIKANLATDDHDSLMAMPALVGGSVFEGSEEDFLDYKMAKRALVGMRAKGSIEEEYIGVNLKNTTPAQQKRFTDRLVGIQNRMNAFIESTVKAGQIVYRKIRHFIPVSDEKQLTQINSSSTQGPQSNITAEDIMFHAKAWAGSLGMDITMLGHADMLSGGLGDGGFMRTSIQQAEESRTMRMAATPFCDAAISLHLLYKTGKVYDKTNQFWKVTFFGGLSAQQAEQEKTNADRIGSFTGLLQALTMMKDLGASPDMAMALLRDHAGLDEAQAKVYADGLIAAQPRDESQQFP